ncbi:MAG: YicC family protein [Planctomycetota bacterium]|nr:YicC family protein [Planctomycetota bacterium]
MTGFGSGSREAAGWRVKAEMRSVNHRHLKVSSHLPDPLLALQMKIDALLREKLERGSISLSLVLEPSDDSAQLSEVDSIRDSYEKLCALRDEITPGAEVRLLDAIQLRQEQGAVVAEPDGDLAQLVLETIEQAVIDLRQMQENEGEHLRKEFHRILGCIGEGLDQVEAVLPEVKNWLLTRFQDRISQLMAPGGVDLDPKDLARELGVQVERSDITEELARMRGHLEEYGKNITEGGRVGRRLDFLTQEMFREANTMASKVARFDLAHTVVDIKVEVDRLREQTQNIE